jgi:hypothetical protein
VDSLSCFELLVASKPSHFSVSQDKGRLEAFEFSMDLIHELAYEVRLPIETITLVIFCFVVYCAKYSKRGMEYYDVA